MAEAVSNGAGGGAVRPQADPGEKGMTASRVWVGLARASCRRFTLETDKCLSQRTGLS